MGGNYTVSTANEFGLGELVDAVEAADFIVAHNAKFELQWLDRCGVDLSNTLVYDTMVGEYVLGGNRYKFGQLSLDNVAKRRGLGCKSSLVSTLIKQGVCPSDIPAEWLQKYCKQDVTLTEQIFLRQRQELSSSGKLAVQYTRCLLTPVLADIERNGMCLDRGKVLEAYAEQEALASDTIRKLNRLVGGVNWNSPKQVAELLYGQFGFAELTDHRGNPLRTPSGAPKAGKEIIERLKARTKEQKEFIKLYKKARHASTQLSKYLEKFKECVENDDGLLHATFNQCATYTHRLSSSGAKYKTQFQNFPRNYKHLFRARHPGWKMGEADGSQLEFRVAVHLCKDAQGLKDIEDKVDVHKFSAEIIFGTIERRQEAKPHTFKPLYGGSSGTTKERRYYEFFKERYRGVAEVQRGWVNEVLANKKLRTEWGLEYYWPDTRLERSGYITNTTSICNYPVQAFATAEIIPIAVVHFWHLLKRSKLSMFLVNTIHDSIICELPDEEEEAFSELAKTSLIDCVYPYLEQVYDIKLSVPLGCETKVGDFWGSGSEKKYGAPAELYAAALV
jgi:DNA polymerase I-like protein with 3'-5' exonuclease and polymerase domains